MADLTVSSPVDTFLQASDQAGMRSAVGLGNVNNTSDANKPISTATQTALDGKLALAGNGSALTGLTQSQISGLTTTDAPTFKNVKVTPATLTYGATPNLDFAGNGYETLTLAGDAALTASNYSAGITKTLRIISDGSTRNLSFPGFVFVGASAPTTIAANKTAILTVTSFGTTAGACVAAYAVQV